MIQWYDRNRKILTKLNARKTGDVRFTGIADTTADTAVSASPNATMTGAG